jgi:hypothetical protein
VILTFFADQPSFNLPSRKQNIATLLSCLVDLMLDSTDPMVMRNCASSLNSMATGNHARKDDVLVHLKELVSSLFERLRAILGDKEKKRSTQSENDEAMSDPLGTEISLCLVLRRLAVLVKQVDVAELLHSDDVAAMDSDALKIFSQLMNVIKDELSVRQWQNQSVETEATPGLWEDKNKKLNSLVFGTIAEGIQLMLTMTAWRLRREIDGVKDSPKPVGDHSEAVRDMRDGLVRICALCLDQDVEGMVLQGSVSDEQVKFTLAVQEAAGSAAGDIRSLFPRAWEQAASPLLRYLAFTEESVLIGGCIRFLDFMHQPVSLPCLPVFGAISLTPDFLALCLASSR